MLERVGTRTLPLVGRFADAAPVVPACCNACRTCMTTNALNLLAAAGAGIVAFAERLYARTRPRSRPGATRA